MPPASSETVSIEGDQFFLHTWTPDLKPRAICVVFHGFLAHGVYPTVRYAAQLLAEANYLVVAADMHGHGKSPGSPGLLPSAEKVLEGGRKVVTYARALDPTSKIFLLGSSMGGTIALSVANHMLDVSGVVLLAPMLQLAVSTPERILLSGLASLPWVNNWQVIPSSAASSDKQYRDPIRRKECEEDKPAEARSSFIAIASASTCVQLAHDIQQELPNVTTPFLLAVAEEDVVVKNQGSYDLYEKSPSIDKTMKKYAALHGLLCEPSPLREMVEKDIIEWLNARC
jgi:acylglycerol lipase